MYNSLKSSFKCFLNLSVPSRLYWYRSREWSKKDRSSVFARERLASVLNGTNEKNDDNAEWGFIALKGKHWSYPSSILMNFVYVVEYTKILDPYFFYQRISRFRGWNIPSKNMDFIVFSKYLRNYVIYKKMFNTKIIWYFVLYIMMYSLFLILNFLTFLHRHSFNFAKFKNFIWTKIKEHQMPHLFLYNNVMFPRSIFGQTRW